MSVSESDREHELYFFVVVVHADLILLFSVFLIFMQYLT